jgi:hypothetical protein
MGAFSLVYELNITGPAKFIILGLGAAVFVAMIVGIVLETREWLNNRGHRAAPGTGRRAVARWFPSPLHRRGSGAPAHRWVFILGSTLLIANGLIQISSGGPISIAVGMLLILLGLAAPIRLMLTSRK